MEDQVIIDTGLVGDGETQSITFNAPDEQGAYDYICTFPGHFTAGMKGTLTVE
jgi:azurin